MPWLLFAFFALFVPVFSHAYYEVPLFEQTTFAREYGMFRWVNGCWYRVTDSYDALVCDDGYVVENTLGRNFGGNSGGFGGYTPTGGGFGNSTGVFFYDDRGNPIDRTESNTVPRSFRESRGGGTNGRSGRTGVTNRGTTGGAGGGYTYSGNSAFAPTGRSPDAILRPLGLGCSSIFEGRETGIFGIAPCTTYPGVLGQVSQY